MKQMPQQLSDQELEQKATDFRNNGQFKAAISAYRELKQRFEARGDIQRAANMIHMIGVSYKVANRVNEALQAYEEATRLYKQAGDTTGVGRVERDHGILYQYNDNLKRALPLLQKSVQTLKQTSDTAELGISEVKLGNVYLDTHDLKRADEWIRRGMDTVAATNNWFYTATAKMHLAKLLTVQHEYEAATVAIDSAQTLFSHHGGSSQNARRYSQIEAMRAFIARENSDTAGEKIHLQKCKQYLSQLDDESAEYLRTHDFKDLFG